LATEEKSKVEDAQRLTSKEREERGETHRPRYFEPNGEGFAIKLKKYVTTTAALLLTISIKEAFNMRLLLLLLFSISNDPQEAKKQIVDFIFNTPAPLP